MKAHIRRFADENNDVMTAEEMNKALEPHGGLRGCRVAVVKIDASEDLNEANKIPDISLLYNFSYEKGGIRVWKAYGIGTGKPLTNTELAAQPQNDVQVTKTCGRAHGLRKTHEKVGFSFIERNVKEDHVTYNFPRLPFAGSRFSAKSTVWAAIMYFISRNYHISC